MLYSFLKIWVGLALKLFCRHIIVENPSRIKTSGPLLIASNHPNSFLDAIIIDIIFPRPVWSLARGDVFKSPFIIRLLHRLKILPVYRTSEGVENLGTNYETFDACKNIFRDNGAVLIFSEGWCINEWHLRPLKKGTARLAISSWNDEIPLKVLPVGINYSSFRRFGKNVFINTGELIDRTVVSAYQSDGEKNREFNKVLFESLSPLVYEIASSDKKLQAEILEIKPAMSERILLAIPAILGFILHAPLYYPIKKYSLYRTNNNDHYDSVLAALIIFIYPFYLTILVLLLWFSSGHLLALLSFILIPFTAWAFVRIKQQLD